jgi:hypothetical protein
VSKTTEAKKGIEKLETSLPIVFLDTSLLEILRTYVAVVGGGVGGRRRLEVEDGAALRQCYNALLGWERMSVQRTEGG